MSEGPATREGASPIDVRTRFERFPASMKGAFVLQGADGNPHSAKFVRAAIARIPAGPSKAIPLEDRMLDVAPRRDLFVPFEVAVSELEPSWYVIESAVEVDAWRTWEFSSRPFTIPWLRTDVRRGTVTVGRPVSVQGRQFVVERVELGSDKAAVVWRSRSGDPEREAAREAGPEAVSEAAEGEAVIIADGEVLEILPAGTGASPSERLAPGEQKTVLYPVPRSARSIEVRVRVPGNAESESIGVSLP